MTDNPFTRIDHPAAWHVAELGGADSIALHLESRHLDALDAAVRTSKRAAIPVESLTRRLFPLDAMASDIEKWRHELTKGRGLLLLRGFPVGDYDVEDMGRMFMGLGTHFGFPVSQNNLGEKLGHVVNVGDKDRRERAYRNSRGLSLHTDRCDDIGMLCLQKACTGGESGYASALTIHNEILATRPELLAPLYAGFRLHRFGEQPPGEPPITRLPVPIFSLEDTHFNVVYIRGYIDLAVDEGLYALDDASRQALDYVDEVANRPDIRFDVMLEPGDAMFTNNCFLLHRRTAFEDCEQPELKRHLLRLWLMDDARPAVAAVRSHKNRAGIEKLNQRGTYYSGTGFKDSNNEAY
ncbi:MAG: TauD/TfdA family dioxygenase [Gammaproteobacteria bacterium]|nr:TauD/TfdA family dioxygenase [Gammaproteobacteria bacterium]MDX2461777.1 TauD/TfdA family dioxygenase [Gammaproteobacteria bacterium]